MLREAAFFSTGADLRPSAFLTDRRPIAVGPFTVTPYLVDHSAYDSYALLIEAGGRRLLYSGDLRGHGRRRDLFDALITGPPRDMHALLLEGTHVRRRPVGAAGRLGRRGCLRPQSQHVKVKRSGQFERVNRVRAHRAYPDQLAREPGRFVLTFRGSMAREVGARMNLHEAAAIWSIWAGYLDSQAGVSTGAWFANHDIALHQLHASGHASIEDLQRLAEPWMPTPWCRSTQTTPKCSPTTSPASHATTMVPSGASETTRGPPRPTHGIAAPGMGYVRLMPSTTSS